MEFGAVKYLTQSDDLVRLWYSEVLQTASTLVGATQVASANYADFGAKYILISLIIFSSGVPAGAANLVTFTDQFNKVLFVMNESRDGNGPYPILKIVQGESFKITATGAGGLTDFNFTVQHQYLREVDKNERSKF